MNVSNDLLRQSYAAVERSKRLRQQFESLRKQMQDLRKEIRLRRQETSAPTRKK